jgi:hypothetical protein
MPEHEAIDPDNKMQAIIDRDAQPSDEDLNPASAPWAP